MSNHHCCKSVVGDDSIQSPTTNRSTTSILRRCMNFVGWAVPGTILVLLPKCPACLAAYIALGTGLGLSFSTASYLRFALIILCTGALAYMMATFIRRSSIIARSINAPFFKRV